jgi:histidyl-tRNA synthetase
VWRADRPARGRFREFYQCDVDAIGSKSPVVEAELCAAVSDVLHRLGFTDFVLKLNDRAVLGTLLANTGMLPAQHADALVVLDKLDKIGPERVRGEMVERGIDPDAAHRLLSWVGAAYPGDWLKWLESQFSSIDDAGRAGFENLRQIRSLSASTSAAAHLKFEPSLARGLSYYTGAIMEVAVPDLAGSLGGGGRYDGLIGMFSGENVPACGFSLGLERILVVMGERGMFPADLQHAAADVLVAIFDAATIPEAMKLASELRSHGVRAELYPEPDKLGKQMKYAASKGIPYAAILGGDELARGEVTIKNLTSGEQVSIARAEVAGHLRRA